MCCHLNVSRLLLDNRLAILEKSTETGSVAHAAVPLYVACAALSQERSSILRAAIRNYHGGESGVTYMYMTKFSTSYSEKAWV